MSVVLNKIGGKLDIEQDELRPLFLGTERKWIINPSSLAEVFLVSGHVGHIRAMLYPVYSVLCGFS